MSTLGPWPTDDLGLSEGECATVLGMARGQHGEGMLRKGGAVQRLTARVIHHLRQRGWANYDLYVRDGGYRLEFLRDCGRVQEGRAAGIEEQVAEFRAALDAADAGSPEWGMAAGGASTDT